VGGGSAARKAVGNSKTQEPPPVKKNTPIGAEAQAEVTEQTNPFLLMIRAALREVAEKMLREEVDRLCGPSHYPLSESPYRRAGTEAGICYADGRKESVQRPRVRRSDADGKEREQVLASYQAMRDPDNNAAKVVTMLQAGMSTRSQEWANEGVTSKSAASRYWMEATAGKVAELRERNIAQHEFVGLMLDGVWLGQNAVVVVALGITREGDKVVLDFEPGASENTAVAKALVARLQARGFGPIGGYRLLVVLDGSASLANAVRASWPEALIQRCVVHKERNLFGYLRKADHPETKRLWQKLRLAEGAQAGREALAALRAFLASRSAAATASLDEAGESLITLHLLNVPSSLNRPLLSTNAIENVMRNYRGQTAKVTRWRAETDQISRWSATALLHLETGFRRIKGHADLPKLLHALALTSIPSGVGGAAPLQTSPSNIALVQTTSH
jgi:transposase-like protein